MGRRERGRRPAMIVSSTGALNKFSEIIFFSAGVGAVGWGGVGCASGSADAPVESRVSETQQRPSICPIYSSLLNNRPESFAAGPQTVCACLSICLSVPLPPTGPITLDPVHTDLGSSHQPLILPGPVHLFHRASIPQPPLPQLACAFCVCAHSHGLPWPAEHVHVSRSVL